MQSKPYEQNDEKGSQLNQRVPVLTGGHEERHEGNEER